MPQQQLQLMWQYLCMYICMYMHPSIAVWNESVTTAATTYALGNNHCCCYFRCACFFVAVVAQTKLQQRVICCCCFYQLFFIQVFLCVNFLNAATNKLTQKDIHKCFCTVANISFHFILLIAHTFIIISARAGDYSFSMIAHLIAYLSIYIIHMYVCNSSSSPRHAFRLLIRHGAQKKVVRL